MMKRGVSAQSGRVSFGDTAAKTLFTLPSGAVPLYAVVQIETAFDDTGTDLLDIGVDGADDYFAADVDVSAEGGKAVPLAQNGALTRMKAVTAKYTGQNANATEGTAVVTMIYVDPFAV